MTVPDVGDRDSGGEVQVPAAVGRDELDPVALDDLRDALGGEQREMEFPDGGHLLPVEEAAGITQALTEWLDRQF